MELQLLRTYHDDGTNGEIYADSDLICYSIELPWEDNKKRISCIPEGRYELKKRYSPRFKHHILVEGVEGRGSILIHPANDAKRELHGCIAPVWTITAPGKGRSSKMAFNKLYKKICGANKPVFITIKMKDDDH